MTDAPTPNLCPFCTLPAERIVDESRMGFVIQDAYPISPGHTLVIARRHIASFFVLKADEGHRLVVV